MHNTFWYIYPNALFHWLKENSPNILLSLISALKFSGLLMNNTDEKRNWNNKSLQIFSKGMKSDTYDRAQVLWGILKKREKKKTGKAETYLIISPIIINFMHTGYHIKWHEESVELYFTTCFSQFSTSKIKRMVLMIWALLMVLTHPIFKRLRFLQKKKNVLLSAFVTRSKASTLAGMGAQPVRGWNISLLSPNNQSSELMVFRCKSLAYYLAITW